MLLIHSAFCSVFSVAIFGSKFDWFPCHPVVMSSRTITLLASRIFSLFWNVQFCQNCFPLSRNLFSLPFFARTFWFISFSCIVCFTRVAFSFLPQHVPAFFLGLIILVVVVDFLSRFSVEFPNQVLGFCKCFFREP